VLGGEVGETDVSEDGLDVQPDAAFVPRDRRRGLAGDAENLKPLAQPIPSVRPCARPCVTARSLRRASSASSASFLVR
jgi:hypothetical protein